MNDYIKREDACRAMRQLQTDDIELYGLEIPESFDANRAIDTLTSLPAADVVERKRGKWREDMWLTTKGYSCSKCDGFVTNSSKFCPNCGADMRVEQDE